MPTSVAVTLTLQTWPRVSIIDPRRGSHRDFRLDQLVQPTPAALDNGYLPPIEWEQQHATVNPLPSTTAA
jgi:hypothetical protein